MEERLKKLEDYCFQQNAQFQTDAWDAVVAKLETGSSLGVGKFLSPDSSALFAVTSPNKGIGFPQMTEAQRDLIMDPIGGLVIYNLDSAKLNVFTTTWEEITSS